MTVRRPYSIVRTRPFDERRWRPLLFDNESHADIFLHIQFEALQAVHHERRTTYRHRVGGPEPRSLLKRSVTARWPKENYPEECKGDAVGRL